MNSVQARMPRKFMAVSISKMHSGEDGWVSKQTLVVDKYDRIWLRRYDVVRSVALYSDDYPVFVACREDGYHVCLPTDFHKKYRWIRTSDVSLDDVVPVESFKEVEDAHTG